MVWQRGARTLARRRRQGRWALAVLALGMALLTGAAAPAAALSPAPDAGPGSWITDGQVTAIASGGGRTYLGGYFSYIGPRTGPGVVVGASDGAVLPGAPQLDGQVWTAVADGLGGIYVGGSFTEAGGAPRTGLLRLRADGTLDPGFAPVLARAADYPASPVVSAMALSGTTLFIGGEFTSAGEQPRPGLAAIDTLTGTVTAWNPTACSGTSEWTPAIDVVAGTVYVAGGPTCHTPEQGWRHTLYALDASTGAVRDFGPWPNGQINDIEATPDVVYVSGLFSRIGGAERNGLAALDAATGAATPWAPAANSAPSALALAGDRLYVGGPFTSIGGEDRQGAARLSTATGEPDSWDPSVRGPSAYSGATLYDIALSGSTVYLAGTFAKVGEQHRRMVAAVDATTGAPSAWHPLPSDTVTLVAPWGSNVLLGGWFTSVGGVEREGLAAVDEASGEALPWDAGITAEASASNSQGRATVSDLILDGGTLYVAGAFSGAGGAARANLAALDASEGHALPWNPSPDGAVQALDRAGGTTYAGGDFTHVGGQARAHLAAIDPGGAVTGWDPGADAAVGALAAGGGRLYVAGPFEHAGGAARHAAAALNLETGAATAWDPQPDGTIRDLAAAPDGVYAAGSFTEIGGDGPAALAKLDAEDGHTLPWDAALGGTPPVVTSVAVLDSTVIAGGTFSSAGGEPRHDLAALNADEGTPLAWAPEGAASVNRVFAKPGALYVAAAFGRHSGYERFTLLQPPGAPVPSVTVTRQGFGLTWGASPDAHHYLLEQRDAEGGWTAVGGDHSAPSHVFSGTEAPEGELRFRAVAVDALGMASLPSAASEAVIVDRTAPAAPSITTDREPDAAGGWFDDAVRVLFDAEDATAPDGSDGSGIDPATLPDDRELTTTGTHTVTATVRDRAGNVSPQATLGVRVDVDAPVVSIACPATVTVGGQDVASWTASDVGSGLAGPASGSVVLAPVQPGPLSAAAPAVADLTGHAAAPAACGTTGVAPITGTGGGPGGGGTAVTQPFTVARAFTLPPAGRCLKHGARLKLVYRRPAGVTVDRVEVLVGKKRVLLRTGAKARRTITLAKLPAKRFTLTVKVTPHGGGKAVAKRTYTICKGAGR